MTVVTQLFVENGYIATTLHAIAHRAGTAPGTLQKRFGGKVAIFCYVMATSIAEMPFISGEIQQDDTLFVALRRAGAEVRAIVDCRRTIDIVRLMIAESTRFPLLMHSAGRAALAKFDRDFLRLSENLERSGLVLPGRLDGRAVLFCSIALGQGALHRALFAPPAPPPCEQSLDQRVQFFITASGLHS